METIKKGRYVLHAFMGILLGYDLFQFQTNHMDLSDWKYFIPNSGIDFGFLAVAFYVFWIAGVWDWAQGKFFGGKFDWFDVLSTTLGSFLGSWLCMKYLNNNWLFYGCMFLGIAIVWREVRNYKSGKK